MVISSRTPEGSPGDCPVCGKAVHLEPSVPFGDAPCPHCGTLLWFVSVGGATEWFDAEASPERKERLLDAIAERFDLSCQDRLRLWSDPSMVEELGIDSLEMIELVMELEESEK